MTAIETTADAPDLVRAIEAGFAQTGKSPDDVTLDDLASVDEFHVRGREATLELVEAADFARDMNVVDLGSGVGGPARVLAARSGARVTGIDLNGDYCETATRLAAWVGLGDRVSFRQGDVTALPFEDAAFDGAWTVHVGMFVADKAALYGEAARVLKPGARFAIYDAFAVPGAEMTYPVPWAASSDKDFALSLQDMTAALDAAGFDVVAITDVTAAAGVWAKATVERLAASDGPPPVGLHLVVGPDLPVFVKNATDSLARGAAAFHHIVCARR